jgi:DNA-binding IclR family transcriptional regulator
MDWNSNDFLIQRAYTKIADTVEILRWVTRHINDVEVTSLADAEFESLIGLARKTLKNFRTISLQHGKPMDLQDAAVGLCYHALRAKRRLEQVKMEEDTEQSCQRQCEYLEKMLSEVSQKLILSKRGGRIFDHNARCVKPP